MIAELSFQDLAVIAGAIAFGGFVKGITGLGLPVLAIPIIAGFLDVQHAVIVLVIPGIVLNVWLTWNHRDKATEIPEMAVFLTFTCVGVLFGTVVLYLASERFLNSVLAAWIAVYLVVQIAAPDFRLEMRTRTRFAPYVGALAGLFQGSTGISGSVIATYFHSLRLAPTTFVFAVAAPFLVMAVAHCVTLIMFGMYTRQLVLQSFIALVPALVSITLGMRLRRYVNERNFNHLILGLLLLVGVRLIYVTWLR